MSRHPQTSPTFISNKKFRLIHFFVISGDLGFPDQPVRPPGELERARDPQRPEVCQARKRLRAQGHHV
jgi:hypothetical protein